MVTEMLQMHHLLISQWVHVCLRTWTSTSCMAARRISALLCINTNLIPDLSCKPALWCNLSTANTLQLRLSSLQPHRRQTASSQSPPLSNLLFHQRRLTVFLAEIELLRHFTAAYQSPEFYILVPDNKTDATEGMNKPMAVIIFMLTPPFI